MLNINTNYGAAFAANAAKKTSNELDSSIEKLSSGSRINYASDDAAGMAISTRLRGEIEGLAMASKNASDAQSMLDTADGALAEVHTALLRMRELAVQSSNDTVTSSDRDAMQSEVAQLEAEIQRISDNTTWAGQNLLDGTFTTGASFQIGADAGQNLQISIGSIDATTTFANGGLNLNSHISTQAAATAYITDIDNAISHISAQRGKLGAASNRLDSTISNLDQIRVNLSQSNARISDTDFALETSNMARNQIMQQAATAMIAQANASKGSVLTLIQG
jgi:flagellin